MSWDDKELYAQVESLIEGAELLRDTSRSFGQVSAAATGFDVRSLLGRDGFGLGPTGPSAAFDDLIVAISIDTGTVARDLERVADNLEVTARDFLRVDDERAQHLRGLLSHLGG